MLKATRLLNQITKSFFRKILVSQGFIEEDFYLKGEVYGYSDKQYFCFKDDLETGTTICFIELYVYGYEWYVEKFCLCNDYILLIEPYMTNTVHVQWKFSILESDAIKIPISYVVNNNFEDSKFLHEKISNLSSAIRFGDRNDLQSLLDFPWLKEMQATVSHIFAYYNVHEFFYIAPFYNICQILISGFIKSRNEIEEWAYLNTNIEDFSNSNVQQLRSDKTIDDKFKLHDFVNLYLNPFNPMIYSKRHEENIAIISISTLVALCQNTYLSDGNAASQKTQFFEIFNGLDQLDWSTIFSNSWHDKPDGKRIRCAEVLIPCSIPVEYIEHIYFKSNIAKNMFLNSLKEIIILMEINEPEYFFLPRFSSLGIASFSYTYTYTEETIDGFIEGVNSISKVQPNLF